ncbi:MULTISPECIES: DAK2 domain-containing protein [Actinotignum]|uniref:DAK2 domain-containing protein n=1 Tax=Actinotignum timonense TaxID=1870995 RepID=A0AAW9HL69_9ACTO|nr:MULTISPECIES: DAK2 domain-containing protein [Actinotignum]AIE81935.1 Dak phosphatase [Actinotignum schaalii]MDE1536977.1 DAK2 domain-containing protein [Actinotignum schaalii]MDE1552838.1 DAK2 domain-containing protein [Actinotignum sanguinis]MDE1565589.1 DAK2 domain-containing protein [Actinotignum sanguinis]MDE1577359.1 DAK2 domain-containing protein [Actinotignum sanguinis]
MKTPELISTIKEALGLLINSADELRDLDQLLGDGDLGITISAGANAVIGALESADPNQKPSQVTRTCAKAFANANPSTMAALVAGGLLAGSKIWGDKEEISRTDAEAFMRAAAESIAQRGKSKVGDKTILDAIVPACDAVRDCAEDADATDAAIKAAAEAVITTRDLQSRRGRASWLQDRSIGLQDPGATAFLRLLEAWRDAIAGEVSEPLARMQ